MELSQQVTCLELAKKLKELGVKQESLFYWYSFDELPFRIRYENETPCTNKSRIYSAFTVAELGEMLPDYFSSYRKKDKFGMAWDENEWKLIGKFKADTDTEADARAKMLIYLIENGLM